MNQTRKGTRIWITFVIITVIIAQSDGIGATSGTCGTNLTWSLSEDGVLTISGTGAMSNYNTTTGTPWETRKASITSLVVNSGVTSIGEYAFYSCTNLASISLPTGLKTINQRAFYNCDSLVSISLPSGLTTIGNRSFSDSNKLKTVSFPATLTTIGEGAFSSCNALTGVVLPDRISNIQSAAFSGTNISSIILPESLSQMGTEVFWGCANLSRVTWSSSLANIPEDTFGTDTYNNSNRLSEVTIPEGVTSIGGGAFYHCVQLTDIYLPVSLENVNSSVVI